jgi:hypothetical protein
MDRIASPGAEALGVCSRTNSCAVRKFLINFSAVNRLRSRVGAHCEYISRAQTSLRLHWSALRPPGDVHRVAALHGQTCTNCGDVYCGHGEHVSRDRAGRPKGGTVGELAERGTCGAIPMTLTAASISICFPTDICVEIP